MIEYQIFISHVKQCIDINIFTLFYCVLGFKSCLTYKNRQGRELPCVGFHRKWKLTKDDLLLI